MLPKKVVSRLRTGEGKDLFLLEGPNNTYRITPFDPAFEKKMEKVEEIMACYRNTLHVLAMSEPIWIENDLVLAIHDSLLVEHGGAEGVRDESLAPTALLSRAAIAGIHQLAVQAVEAELRWKTRRHAR